MKQIKQIKDFLQKKGNGFLLWGLTICVFFLYSLNKDELANAWKGVKQLPKIAETLSDINHKHDSLLSKIDTIQTRIEKVDSSGQKRDIILRKDLKQVTDCVKNIARTINQDTLIKNLSYFKKENDIFADINLNLYSYEKSFN